MNLQIEVFTLFPQMIDQYVDQSILGRATESELLKVTSRDLRAEAKDPHRTVDDSPFGGGAGMVMMPEPVFAAVEQADPPRPLILLGPGGAPLINRWPKSWPPSTAFRYFVAATKE